LTGFPVAQPADIKFKLKRSPRGGRLVLDRERQFRQEGTKLILPDKLSIMERAKSRFILRSLNYARFNERCPSPEKEWRKFNRQWFHAKMDALFEWCPRKDLKLHGLSATGT
jgi:hypothetical protein